MSIQYNLGFDNQVKVGVQFNDDGVYATREEYYDSRGWDFNGDEDGWVDYTWSSEVWRIDFVLSDRSKKLAIEIDGKEWHKDKHFDDMRDKDLQFYGYETIHFPASDVIKNVHKIKSEILRCFNMEMVD